jgi:hypothetical protein
MTEGRTKGRTKTKKEGRVERKTKVRTNGTTYVSVRDTHGGGWSRNINARYLHTLMVYL